MPPLLRPIGAILKCLLPPVRFPGFGPHRRRWGWSLWAAIAFSLSLWLHFGLLTLQTPAALSQGGSPATDPSPAQAQGSRLDPKTLMEQGRSNYEAGQFAEAVEQWAAAAQIYEERQAPLNQAIALSYLARAYQELDGYDQAVAAMTASLEQLPRSPDHTTAYQVQAQVLSTQGELQLLWGQPEAAMASWDQAAIAYDALNDSLGLIGIRVNQSQALRSLGLYYQAEQQISPLADDLATLPDSALSLTAWRSLGNTQSALGYHDEARHAFERSLAMAQTLNDGEAAAAAWLSLGNLERALGDRQLNRQLLAARQSLVRQSYCPDWNTEKLSVVARDHYQQAFTYYQQVLESGASLPLQVRSRLNRLSLDLLLKQTPAATEISQLSGDLDTLPPSRFAVYGRVHLAQDLNCLSSDLQLTQPDGTLEPLRLLAIAIDTARSLHDKRAESYALGQLGRLYESRLAQSPEAVEWAKTATEEAMGLAQQIQASDIAYLWQWQMGRLLQAQGQGQSAREYYAIAFETLQTLRSDLVVLDTDIQFAFREKIEPLYRQYADMLLQDAASSQANLQKARSVIEALQLAELDNFFRDACSVIQPESLDAIIDRQGEETGLTSAVLYTILLPNRLDVVLKVPQSSDPQAQGSDLFSYSSAVSAAEVRRTALEFRKQLVQPHTLRTVEQPAQQLYDWLIRPAAAELEAYGIDHLVFVLDGGLRNIPMAALHDGDRYLLERYSVSLSPGLQVLESNILDRQAINVIAAGISNFSQRLTQFPPLPYVEQELEAIAATVPQVTRLLNQDFTRSKLMAALNQEPTSIVHLASHGQFSSLIEETFILAYKELNPEELERQREGVEGAAVVNPETSNLDESSATRLGGPTINVDAIGINELAMLLKGESGGIPEQTIDLLVLSACQTASGDERATLGLAGVAVRAGARSTLASLWSVDDQATSLLIAEFYRQLYQSGANTNKVESLKQAQQYIKNFQNERGDRPFQHPRYWSPFVLLGDWL